MKTREPLWIDERTVLAIHDRLLAIHGGAAGLRDQGLLESALARPREHRAYSPKSNIVELAALYTVGIVRNHPFTDGNKRTGFVTGILFLELNGFVFTAAEEEATQAVISAAAGTVDEVAFAAWLQAHSRAKRRGT